MLSPALLTALLEAERALGRLAEACQEPEKRRRLWADAARREACAAARLDGVVIDPTDFLIATVNPDLIPTVDRPAALSVHALWQGARFAQGQRDVSLTRFQTRSPVRRHNGNAAADAWRAVAALEGGAAQDSDSGLDTEQNAGDPAESNRRSTPAPWTLTWIESSWRVLEADLSGRDPAHLTLSVEREAEVMALLNRLERAGEVPALMGSVGLLAELLRPPPDLRTPAWLRPSARLLAPLAIARSCRLPNLWLPMSIGMWTDRTAAAIAARGAEDGWRLWLTDMVAETARRERQRLATLDQAAQSWQRRMGVRRRNSRLPDVIAGLFDRPAFTVRHLQRRLGTTFRGAQLLVNDLVDAGVLREVTNRALDRVFVAVELLP
jgi:hypothetical protein